MAIGEQFNLGSDFIPKDTIRIAHEYTRDSDIIIGIDPASDNSSTGIAYYRQNDGTWVVDSFNWQVKLKEIPPNKVHLSNPTDRINALLD